jgi:orotidine-5'-phosphate decarboxylase
MTFNLRDAWLAAVDKKNSILCAGIDPADCIMGRTDKGAGLPAGTDKRDWIFKYMAAVGPYVSAFKPNVRYFGGRGENEILNEIGAWARELGAVFIQDSKEADIGETNDAGIFRAALRGAHAVTLAPFAGNMEEAARQGRDRNIGLITMCLMSSPDYATIKNMWVAVPNDAGNYDPADIKEIDGVPHTRFYMKQARDANRLGLAGIVLGAPSSSNHIKESEVEKVSRYLGKDALLLVPGIGAQGGEVTALTKYFDATRMIANVGRALMFPEPGKAYATSVEQAAAAEKYRDMLNELRKAA